MKVARSTNLAVLSALHGEWGEDGRIQAILESLGVPYTGSGVLPSAIGMHKYLSYKLADWAGLRVPAHFILHAPASADVVHARIAQSFGYPCVVKPNGLGSSIGVSVARSRPALARALKAAFALDHAVLVQQFISGAEVTCGVLGNTAQTELLALPPVLIRMPRGTFFDYAAKYHSPMTKELCPAPLPPKTIREIEAAAQKAHALYEADGLTRSDFILARNGTLYFLEINTAPGMTEASLCPKEAKALGWSFAELLQNIIGLALVRHGYKKRP
jgi:D-alanine-D-alanine ligase